MSALERIARMARAVVFATVCVVMSAGGHVLAGGAPVTAQTLLVGMAVAFALAFALSGRERGPEIVLVATAGAQLLLHEMFTRSAPDAVAHAEQMHAGTSGVGMPVAHLVVAVVSGWWLYRGESAFWLMVRLWGMAPLPRLRRLLVGEIDPVASAIWVTPVAEAVAYLDSGFMRAVRRRGPPAGLIAR
ncbi:hypothetical protein ABZW11_18165 [Nonomuraea sp. NPDC004580]|uniref:hypothetical protein n=1 Tax=Nonomuraea sp. NPDC004580 TaxID=3154552 RepID=UPI0033A2C521